MYDPSVRSKEFASEHLGEGLVPPALQFDKCLRRLVQIKTSSLEEIFGSFVGGSGLKHQDRRGVTAYHLRCSQRFRAIHLELERNYGERITERPVFWTGPLMFA